MVLKKNQLNICYISFRKKLETNLEQLSRCVAMYGHSVTIILLSDCPKKKENTKDGRVILYINLGTKLNVNRLLTVRLKRILFILKAIKELNKHEYSIFHIDFGCKYFGMLKLFYRETKCIYHIQSFPMSLTKSSFNIYKKMLEVFLQSFLMDAIIVQSKEQKEQWIGTGRLKRTKIIPIGFNNKMIHAINRADKVKLREKMGIGLDRTVFIYTGAITKFRELNRLVYAIKIVEKKHSQIKVLMIGKGDALEEIRRLAKSLKLLDTIDFIGTVPYDNMVKYYGVADVGLSYIPININFNYNPPLKTYEYLACALPCIATKTVSNAMIIEDQKNGILVNDTPSDIASAMIDLLKDKKKVEFMSKNCSASVCGHEFEALAARHLLPLYAALSG